MSFSRMRSTTCSMIEGIRRSGAERVIFRHNDVAYLDEQMGARMIGTGRSSWLSRASKQHGWRRGLRLPRSAMSPINITRSPIWTRSMASASMVHVAVVSAERDGVADRITIIEGTLAKGIRRDGRLYRSAPGNLGRCHPKFLRTVSSSPLPSVPTSRPARRRRSAI